MITPEFGVPRILRCVQGQGYYPRVMHLSRKLITNLPILQNNYKMFFVKNGNLNMRPNLSKKHNRWIVMFSQIERIILPRIWSVTVTVRKYPSPDPLPQRARGLSLPWREGLRGGWRIFMPFCEPFAHDDLLCKKFLFFVSFWKLQLVANDGWHGNRHPSLVFGFHFAIISKHFFAFTWFGFSFNTACHDFAAFSFCPCL